MNAAAETVFPVSDPAPDASAAVAQTRGAGRARVPSTRDGLPEGFDPGAPVGYEIGSGVRRAARMRPYERYPDDPLYRPLRIYTTDAAASLREGSVTTLQVPYEPLEPGPRGAVLEVEARDPAHGCAYAPLDLEEPAVLIGSGVGPAPSDHRFHLQMVYAVASHVYDTFRVALGRVPAWGFDPPGEGRARLRLRPFAACGECNAWYSPADGEVAFGYYRAGDDVQGRNLPGGWIFSALSHDVVVHEVTHALLDGLRTRFLFPSRPDVIAFHEGFADLVAYFLRFSYREVVLAAIRDSRGDLREASLLTELAKQFGQTSGHGRALRHAVNDDAVYRPSLEPHALGNVLVAAVFEAFVEVFERKTRRFLRLTTNGSGVLRPGDLPRDLQEILAEAASKLAGQFLRMIVRAVDYCPPADLSFGEFLRAVLTADHDLVPDDPWGYREAWTDAFARRRIYPHGVGSLAESELLWQPPPVPLAVPGLSFGEMKLSGDPARPADASELERQARALGAFVARRNLLAGFGLAEPGETVGPPTVQSIRTSRRIGPDGQVVFDQVAEITQRQVANGDPGRFETYGGSTVIVGPRGEIRYVILTRADGEKRRQEQRRWIAGPGTRYWHRVGGLLQPRPDLLRLVHLLHDDG